VGDVRRRKRPANQAKPAEVTNSIQTYTTTSDGPVMASTTRFMKSSDSLKSTATRLPSSKDLLTINLQVTRWPVHVQRAAPVKWPSLRAALTLVVKLKPQSPKAPNNCLTRKYVPYAVPKRQSKALQQPLARGVQSARDG
jgi:hypothetical protein